MSYYLSYCNKNNFIFHNLSMKIRSRNFLKKMRNRNNNQRHTIWTEHFTIRSYLKDFSEFNQGLIDITVKFTRPVWDGPIPGQEHIQKNTISENHFFRKTLFEVHFLVTYYYIADMFIVWNHTHWFVLCIRIHKLRTFHG